MPRQVHQTRKTNETQIEISLNLDLYQAAQIQTDSPFFSHMLEQLAKHSLFDMQIIAKGDVQIDDHHLVEDTGILLGTCFHQALGERTQIKRYGSGQVPMDEALVYADIDLTTRPFLAYDLQPGREFIGNFDTSLPLEFWRAFVYNCGLNLHIRQIYGQNAHHLIEASFKAVALALRQACQIDPAQTEKAIISTKGKL